LLQSTLNTVVLLIVGCFLFLWVAPTAFCQNYAYTNYTIEDGLPTNYVYGVTEDKDGTIWAYTEKGIAKFDGYKFKVYTTREGLPHNDIFYITRDSFNTLWLHGFFNNPCYLKEDSIYTIQQKTTGAFNFIPRNIFFSGKDSFFQYNQEQILQKTDKQVEQFISNQPWGQQVSILNKILFNINHQSFLVDNNKLIEWKAGKIDSTNLSIPWSKTIYPPFYLETTSKKIVTFWSYDKGFYAFNMDDNIETSISWASLGLGTPAHFNGFQNGEDLYLMTNQIILKLNAKLQLKKVFRFENIANKYTLSRFYVDRQDNFWLGTREGGLFFIAQTEQNSEHYKLPFSNDIVFEQFLKLDDQLFAISDKTGLYEVFSSHIENLVKPKQPLHNSSIQVNKQQLLVSGANRSYIYNTNTNNYRSCEYLSDNDEDCSIPIIQGIVGPKHLLWSKNNDTLFIASGGYLKLYLPNTKKAKYLDTLRVTGLTINAKGIVYVSSGDRILAYQNNRLIPVKKIDDYITYINFFDHQLWIGSESKGLFILNTNSNDLKQKATYRNIRKIVADQNELYIAFEKGLAHTTYKQGKLSENYVYGKKDGIPQGFINDIAVDGDHIYCATSNGLVKVNKNYNKPKEGAAVLNIHSISIDDKSLELNQLNPDQPLRLLGNQSLKIKYALQHYASKGKVQYFAKLEPAESKWRVTEDRELQYTALKSGNYELKLKAVDINGKEHLSDRKIRIKVLLPVWKRWWFISLMAIALACYFYFLWQRQRKRLLKKEKRNRELANLKLENLRSQMNPHFIFNTLGSIQYYIQTNDADKADAYLSKFARLMRKYLEAASEKLISLEEELQLLKEYTNLEEMRFENQFKTVFYVDNELLIHDIYMPGMLIQPFIENAIIHGLPTRKDKEGKISVEFKNLDDNYFTCIIADNGIGIKEKSKSTHRSKGMKNIETRMKVLQEAGIADVSLNISNAFESTEFPGTKIHLKISKNTEHA